MMAKAKFKLMAFDLLSVSAAAGGIGLFAPRTPAEQRASKNELRPAPVVAKPEVKRLEQEVYSVFDLVVDLRSSPDQPTVEDKLIRLIVDVTAPRTWADRGGRGTIDYFLPAKALVVNQTPDVQDQIAELLRLLRRLAYAERGGVFVTTLIESNEGRAFLRRYFHATKEKKQATKE